MILSDTEILRRMKAGEIIIEPFDRECLGSNSYDVHLSKHILAYDLCRCHRSPVKQGHLHADKPGRYWNETIHDDGMMLKPGILYLASTVEYTETHNCVPFLDGKSSAGRLGIFIHATAGRGDAGFKNHWTMELSVVHPVWVVPGMPIGQLIYHSILGEVERPYDKKPNSTQRTERNPQPVPSGMYKNFPLKRLAYVSADELDEDDG